MKSLSKILSLLTVSTVMVSCNEKISPELQSGNSSSTTTTTTAANPDTYYFKVTNNSAAVLNYVLHRTGDRTGLPSAEPCKIESSTLALNNESYIDDTSSGSAHSSKLYDISCFFEAEELALYHNGISFNVEASKNTCDYIGYAPFSYFDAIPGSTRATFVGETCDSGVVRPNCNTMEDTSLPAINRITKDITTSLSLQEFCQFNYAANGGGNGKNCDVGFVEATITHWAKKTNEDGTPAPPEAQEPITTKINCGGTVDACVGGPIKLISSISKFTRGSEIYRTELNQNFKTSFSIPSLYGKNRSGSFEIVNFRRGLSSLNLNYVSYDESNWPAWDKNDPDNKSFDANIMERYAANRDPLGTDQLVSTAEITAKESSYDGVNVQIFAIEPFMASLAAYRTNPFYTFYCLDSAFEIKARIRMVVREWDRVFPSSTANLELISDLGLNVPGTGNPDDQRRQDIPRDSTGYDLEEVDSDPGLYNTFNDVRDWDDLIPMQRSDTSATPASTLISTGNFVLSPMPDGAYVDGWWNPSIFPNQGSSN
jgi:hypothetical protein